jgi:predicted TPR repeat methyltransferase
MSTLKNKYKEQYILFLEAGFIAVNQMDEPAAVRLFTAAKILNPHSVLNEIGFGYLYMCKLELKKAVEHYGKAIEMEPENEMAKTFLALTMAMTNHHVTDSEKILSTLSDSEDPEVRKLSHQVMEFIDQFIKKKHKS